MQFKNLIVGAAVLFASDVLAGSATIVNNCGFDVYYASVGGSANPSMQLLQGSYTEAYGADNVGISIKLATSDNLGGPITQFEMTPFDGKISWDVSNINGYPFSSGGLQVVPSMQGDPSNPTCVPVTCPAGQSVCSAAYNAPDDVRTMVCNEASDLTLTLCSAGGAKRSIIEAGADMISRLHARHFPRQA
jgi:hypothetical protein